MFQLEDDQMLQTSELERFLSDQLSKSKSRPSEKGYTPESDPLHQLFVKYGTDKSNAGYVHTYSPLLTPLRDSVERVLEIGVGTLDWTVPHTYAGNVHKHPHYRPGGSLRAWRDFFPNAFVHGIDIGPDCEFEEDRIKTFRCDSTSLNSCKNFLYNFRYDLIIDDGDHTPLSQLLSFINLAYLVNPGGIYIIEDVGGYGGYCGPDDVTYKPHLYTEFEDALDSVVDRYGFTRVNDEAIYIRDRV